MLGPISPHSPPPSPLVVRLPHGYLWNPAAQAAVSDLVWQLWVCVFRICSGRESLISQGLSSCTLKAAAVVLKSCLPWYAPSQWLSLAAMSKHQTPLMVTWLRDLPEAVLYCSPECLHPTFLLSLYFSRGQTLGQTLPSPSGPFHMFSHRSLH